MLLGSSYGIERSGRDPGQEGVVPGGVGAIARAYAAGMAVDAGAKLFALVISDRLWQFDQLSRWLDREGSRRRVDPRAMPAVRRVAASAGVVTLVAPQSMTLPYEYLRALGLTPAPPPVPHGPVEDLLAGYGRYLLIERGLTPHTVRDAYVPAARLFLVGRDALAGCAWTGSLPPDVSMSRRGSARSAPCRERGIWCPHCAGSRYLHLSGLIEVPLVWALPPIADLRDRRAAAGLGAGGGHAAAGQLRPAQTGRAVYFAILLLLSRLGLRAGEVAGLRLDDVDWRRGLLLIRGKGGRYDELPFPTMSARRWCRTCGVGRVASRGRCLCG